MADRLRNSRSLYLRQHADNPIDWYEWSEEAFEVARREGKPIFLSIGYASCHWCHVMAHESFEKPEVAALLNASVVSIKVDREERPDIDDTYMTAVQLSTGRGGWPMTIFMTTDGKPFFAGTYFPPEDRGDYPGFPTIVRSVAEAWRDHRDELIATADRFAVVLAEAMSRDFEEWPGLGEPGAIAHLVEDLHQGFDPDNGGFGDRPKFPPHTALRFLARLLRSDELDTIERELPGAEAMAREMLHGTLDGLLRGGIHDHVGGGFHRYSTDRRWILPHFEKTLYDNAQLLEVLALASKDEGPHTRRYGETADALRAWLERELLDERGFLYSGIDADSEGMEGRYYLWSQAEIRAAIGFDPDFEAAYHVESTGNYEDEASGEPTGLNVLFRTEWRGSYRAPLDRLFEERSKRVRPSTDDKAIAAWNGLAIVALCEAGHVDLALRCAGAWRALPELPHQVVRGEPSGLPFLDDVALMGLAYHRLHRETGEPHWEDAVRRIVDEILPRYSDRSGVYWYTTNRHETLIARSRPALDQQMPSANAAAIRLLLAVGEREKASTALRRLSGWMERLPSATESLFDCLLDLGGLDEDRVRAGVDLYADGVGLLHLHVPIGWRVYVPGSGEPYAALTVEGEGSEVELEFGPGLTAIEGDRDLLFRIASPADLRAVRLRYQACSDSQCLPVDEIVIPVSRDD
jgi:uncharacterized protein YyaL (SSP411 family)